MISRIKCWFGYHKFEITNFIMPYERCCICCGIKHRFVINTLEGQIWMPIE